MRMASWTEAEQMKVVWNIIDSEMMFKTQPRTKERKAITDSIVAKLLADPDFSERLKSDEPERTIYQHIQAWVGYLERRREGRPPLIR
ncbi:hypothetical protein [Peribacillus asahii]|uniref:hypothetical protein n=1 Tax=Peribacillus asahii TaxID=228899 RepID=UPI0020796E3E|nr:hypothetical protein [Peribacillus asahii]USK62168.1 hypothetical protein LIT37_23615 [Peribacillus asahii]